MFLQLNVMKFCSILSAIVNLVVLNFSAFSQVNSEFPFEMRKLSDRTIVFNETLTNTNITAVLSNKGIIVIDTYRSFSYMDQLRELIEKEFKRSDFFCIINTHGHWDHTSGNQVFNNCLIVGHENCVDGMHQYMNFLPAIIAQGKEEIAGMKKRLENIAPDSNDAENLITEINLWNKIYENYEKGFVFTPPNMTFNDCLNINLDDINLKLTYFGSAHSAHDILIHIPEEKILIVGDVFYHKKFLTYFHIEEKIDVPRWIRTLSEALNNNNVEQIVPGHGPLLTRAEMSIWYDYIVELWEGISKIQTKNIGFEDVKKQFALKNKFSYLEKLGFNEAELEIHHQIIMQAFWRQFRESSTGVIEKVLRKSGIKAAEIKFQEMRNSPNNNYSFFEPEYQKLGYLFLYEKKVDEAVFIFECSVNIFPESAAAFENLAEAYMTKGDKENAIKYYKKAVELNPNNANAKARIAELEKR
ncbi:MBL fold metallo-hydrolase [candidate division KSB1 bacterium]